MDEIRKGLEVLISTLIFLYWMKRLGGPRKVNPYEHVDKRIDDTTVRNSVPYYHPFVRRAPPPSKN